jgi:mono/diheme cytochrome c family protein
VQRADEENDVRSSKLIGGLALVLAGATGMAYGQPTIEDLGRLEFEGNCASCHGVTGKGDGRLKGFLTKAPTDLTTLSKRNGGAFPNQMVWEIIDGRTEVGAHGSRDMPVWGRVFRSQALQYPGMANQPEWYVRGRIVALLDYMARIQVK